MEITLDGNNTEVTRLVSIDKNMNPTEEAEDESRPSECANLCVTPAVDPEYLVNLTTRLANFAAQKKSRMTTGLLLQEEMKKRLVSTRRPGRAGSW